MEVDTANDHQFAFCTQSDFTTLKVVLWPEVKVWKALVLKRNQVYGKWASNQPQETKCNFDMIFEWKCTNMRHLWPYWPQIASESQDEFWVRHSKIHQILIRLLRRLLWWSDLKKLGIFWMLTKIWINKTIYDNILFNKKLVNLCYKSVYSSHKH